MILISTINLLISYFRGLINTIEDIDHFAIELISTMSYIDSYINLVAILGYIMISVSDACTVHGTGSGWGGGTKLFVELVNVLP